MGIDLRDWLPDLWQYKLTLLYVALQLAALRWCRKGRRQVLPRPASDLTWFVPMFVWGLESLHHLGWWILTSHGYCFGPPFDALLWRWFLSGVLMVGTLIACFVSEFLARRMGWAARPAQATLPLPVVAALLGVHGTWVLGTLLFFPKW